MHDKSEEWDAAKAASHSVSINLSTRWQTPKKEGKFGEHGLVGVCGYGRGRVRRKQAEMATNCSL